MIICPICTKRPATVHITVLADGQVTETIQLCEPCALHNGILGVAPGVSIHDAIVEGIKRVQAGEANAPETGAGVSGPFPSIDDDDDDEVETEQVDILLDDFADLDLSGPDSESEEASTPADFQETLSAKEAAGIRCPSCGISLDEIFHQNGRFGCPEDYSIFSKEIRPLLVKLHGSDQHRGKAPTPAAQLERLKLELQLAIDEERYEDAANLRDRIGELEG